MTRPLDGTEGWDAYAAFYDWENQRTVGRRDVAFWRALALKTGGRVLELGCGTGRVSGPLLRAGVPLSGVDRSPAMLARARQKLRRAKRFRSGALALGDIRTLPFASGAFRLVLAPYGILQSLLSDRAMRDTLESVGRVLEPGGLFGIDLVPDVPRWHEYHRRVALRGTKGPAGTPVTLVESVRQDRARRLTVFEQEYAEGRGARRRLHTFSLSFRTLSIPSVCARLERAGFQIDAVLGDYRGGAWDERADTWIVLARKAGVPGR